MDPKNLPGHLKVAILLQAIGREETEKILNSMHECQAGIINVSADERIPGSLCRARVGRKVSQAAANTPVRLIESQKYHVPSNHIPGTHVQTILLLYSVIVNS